MAGAPPRKPGVPPRYLYTKDSLTQKLRDEYPALTEAGATDDEIFDRFTNAFPDSVNYIEPAPPADVAPERKPGLLGRFRQRLAASEERMPFLAPGQMPWETEPPAIAGPKAFRGLVSGPRERREDPEEGKLADVSEDIPSQWLLGVMQGLIPERIRQLDPGTVELMDQEGATTGAVLGRDVGRLTGGVLSYKLMYTLVGKALGVTRYGKWLADLTLRRPALARLVNNSTMGVLAFTARGQAYAPTGMALGDRAKQLRRDALVGLAFAGAAELRFVPKAGPVLERLAVAGIGAAGAKTPEDALIGAATLLLLHEMGTGRSRLRSRKNVVKMLVKRYKVDPATAEDLVRTLEASGATSQREVNTFLKQYRGARLAATSTLVTKHGIPRARATQIVKQLDGLSLRITDPQQLRSNALDLLGTKFGISGSRAEAILADFTAAPADGAPARPEAREEPRRIAGARGRPTRVPTAAPREGLAAQRIAPEALRTLPQGFLQEWQSAQAEGDEQKLARMARQYAQALERKEQKVAAETLREAEADVRGRPTRDQIVEEIDAGIAKPTETRAGGLREAAEYAEQRYIEEGVEGLEAALQEYQPPRPETPGEIYARVLEETGDPAQATRARLEAAKRKKPLRGLARRAARAAEKPAEPPVRPVEAPAAVAVGDVVHTMPDGTVMAGPAHEGAVEGSERPATQEDVDLIQKPADPPAKKLPAEKVAAPEVAKVTPEEDAEYLAAVERGDIKAAQKMADEAASKAGYKTKAFHGARVPDAKRPEGVAPAVFFSDNPNVARVFQPRGKRGQPPAFYLDLGNSLDATGDMKNLQAYTKPGRVARAKEQGFDSVVQRDSNIQGLRGTEIVVFSRTQIKSANTVLRDDAGDAVPLSERFQPEKPAKVVPAKLPVEKPLPPKAAALKRKAAEKAATKRAKKAPVFKTGQSVTFDYIRSTVRAPDMGARFGQDIEPAGRYMNVAYPAARGKQFGGPGWERGSITFENPLIVAWGAGYQERGNWKPVLSRKYDNKTGKALSNALVADGYDAVVVMEESGVISEIVALPKRKKAPPKAEALKEKARKQRLAKVPRGLAKAVAEAAAPADATGLTPRERKLASQRAKTAEWLATLDTAVQAHRRIYGAVARGSVAAPQGVAPADAPTMLEDVGAAVDPKKGLDTTIDEKADKETLMLADTWKNSMRVYQGGKRRMAAPTTKAVLQAWTPEQRAEIDTIYEPFAGGGNWGLFNALTSFPNAKRIVLAELLPEGVAKIRYIHERGDKFAEDLVTSGALPQLRAAYEQMKREGQWSSGTLGKIARELPPSDAALTKTLLGLVADYGDAFYGGKDLDGMLDRLKSQLRRGKEAADELKARGGTIEYRQQDSYASPVVEGNNVLMIADPPYGWTVGYREKDPETGKVVKVQKVGLDTYQKTGDLLSRAAAADNHIIYTDSTFWRDPADLPPDFEKWKETSAEIDEVLDFYDTVKVKTGKNRWEAIGVRNAARRPSDEGVGVAPPARAERKAEAVVPGRVEPDEGPAVAPVARRPEAEVPPGGRRVAEERPERPGRIVTPEQGPGEAAFRLRQQEERYAKAATAARKDRASERKGNLPQRRRLARQRLDSYKRQVKQSDAPRQFKAEIGALEVAPNLLLNKQFLKAAERLADLGLYAIPVRGETTFLASIQYRTVLIQEDSTIPYDQLALHEEYHAIVGASVFQYQRDWSGPKVDHLGDWVDFRRAAPRRYMTRLNNLRRARGKPFLSEGQAATEIAADFYGGRINAFEYFGKNAGKVVNLRQRLRAAAPKILKDNPRVVGRYLKLREDLDKEEISEIRNGAKAYMDELKAAGEDIPPEMQAQFDELDRRVKAVEAGRTQAAMAKALPRIEKQASKAVAKEAHLEERVKGERAIRELKAKLLGQIKSQRTDINEKQRLVRQLAETILPPNARRRALIQIERISRFAKPATRQKYAEEAARVIEEEAVAVERNTYRNKLIKRVGAWEKRLAVAGRPGKFLRRALTHSDKIRDYLDSITAMPEAKAEKLKSSHEHFQEHPDDPLPTGLAADMEAALRPNIHAMSVADLKAALEDLRSLDKTGKLKWELQEVQAKRQRAVRAKRAVGAIRTAGKIEVQDPLQRIEQRRRQTRIKRTGDKMRSAAAQFIRPERMFRWLEGYDPGRPLFSQTFKVALDAERKYMERREQDRETWERIRGDVNLAKAMTQPLYTLEYTFDGKVQEKPLTLADMMFVYGMAQSEGGRRHLHGTGLTDDMIADVDKNLPDEGRQMMQRWFDYARNEQYPAIDEVFARQHHVHMEPVENYLMIENIETDRAENAIVADMLARQSTKRRPGVEKGPTIARVRSEAPFAAFDVFGSMVRSQKWASRYVAYNDAIREIGQFMNVPEVREAIGQRSKAVQTMLDQWLRDTAIGRFEKPKDLLNKWAEAFSLNATVAILPLNIPSIIVQTASVFVGGAKLDNPAHVGTSLSRYIANPIRMTKYVNQKSTEQRNRGKSWEREAAQLYEGSELHGFLSKLPNKDQIRASLFFFQRMTDKFTTTILWDARYREVLNKNLDEPNAEELAVDAADELIRNTQPMGGIMHLPQIMKTPGVARSMTRFTNQLNQHLNIIYEMKNDTTKGFSRKALMFMAMILSGIYVFIIRHGRLPRDEKEVADALLSQVSDGIPVGGQIMRGALLSAMGADRGDLFKLDLTPLGLRAPEDIAKGLATTDMSAALEALGEGDIEKAMKEISPKLVGGIAMGLGAPGFTQLSRSYKGMKRFEDTADPRYLIWSKYRLDRRRADFIKAEFRGLGKLPGNSAIHGAYRRALSAAIEEGLTKKEKEAGFRTSFYAQVEQKYGANVKKRYRAWRAFHEQ